MLRKCPKCKKTKLLSEFSKNHTESSGHNYTCKNCMKEYYYIPKRLHILKKCKEYKVTHKKIIAQKSIVYRSKNKENILNQGKEYYKNNKEKINNKHKLHYQTNREQILKRHQKYYQEHKIKIMQRFINRKRTNPLFKLRCNLSIRTYHAFKQILHAKKNCRTFDIIGLTPQETKSYIENKFTTGMTWDNYGRKLGIKCWEIDHIIPLSSAKTKEEMIRFCHYTNLQPLWHLDNIKKSNKINI